MKLHFLLIEYWQEANYTELVRQPRNLGFQLSFSHDECKEGYYWLIVAVSHVLLELALIQIRWLCRWA